MKKFEFNKTQKIVFLGLFVALIAIGAFIKIPTPLVPFSMQFVFTLLAGLLLGGYLGGAAVGINILLGLIGVPVFTSGGGIWYVLKPTFGYMIGFMASSIVVGLIANKVKNPSYLRLIGANFLGLFIVYLFGATYFYFITVSYLGGSISFWPLILNCCLVFAPSDSAFCIIAALIAKKLIPILNGMRKTTTVADKKADDNGGVDDAEAEKTTEE